MEASIADGLLIFITVTLFAIVAICELDHCGYTIGAVCPTVGSEVLVPCLVGP
jgi:hypothetical protein